MTHEDSTMGVRQQLREVLVSAFPRKVSASGIISYLDTDWRAEVDFHIRALVDDGEATIENGYLKPTEALLREVSVD